MRLTFSTSWDMQNYFPGGMHLAIRSAETLSVQISMCAVGKFGYKKDFML